jgi:hypothetical protein
MRLFVLVTSAFATHARSMAAVEDFQSLWLQLLALVYVVWQHAALFISPQTL